MTTPARGLFRAIASFARFCTPDAPGSLHINTPANSRLIPRTSGTSTPVYHTEPLSITSMTDTPQALSPVGGRNETLKGDTLLMPPAEMSSGSHDSDRSGASSQHSTVADVSGPPSEAGNEVVADTDGSRPLPPTKPASGPIGDDAGPRFGEEDASLDSRAKPGEAGHSGIYNGESVSRPSYGLIKANKSAIYRPHDSRKSIHHRSVSSP
jgi:hypothetical protein